MRRGVQNETKGSKKKLRGIIKISEKQHTTGEE
jgi:hypothetical protein